MPRTQYGTDVVDPTYSSDDAPRQNTEYHPQSVRTLNQLRDSVVKLLEQVDAAINAAPPPYVAPVDATPKRATVTMDAAEVFETPHENARVVGEIARGAVLTLTLDASRDEAYTWYKISGGQHNGKYVKGNYLNMQQ